MSEEELRALREFERKEEELLQEREKLKKALEAELRKLQSTIAQSMENFNDKLQKLFQLKIKTEMAVNQVQYTTTQYGLLVLVAPAVMKFSRVPVCQEELKILALVGSLQTGEEVRGRERQLHSLLHSRKAVKVVILHVICQILLH